MPYVPTNFQSAKKRGSEAFAEENFWGVFKMLYVGANFLRCRMTRYFLKKLFRCKIKVWIIFWFKKRYELFLDILVVYKGKVCWKTKNIDLTSIYFSNQKWHCSLALRQADFQRPTSRVQPTDIKFGHHLHHHWRFACSSNTIKSGLGFFGF